MNNFLLIYKSCQRLLEKSKISYAFFEYEGELKDFVKDESIEVLEAIEIISSREIEIEEA